MIRLAVLIVAVFLPGMSRAETVPVRSGEHPDFTRLVLDFEVGADWVFGRVEGGFEFRPGRSDVSYDLEQVFDRIPRTRIREVEDLGDGRLFLAVDCPCHGDAFDLRRGRVVLDIKDGPPTPSASSFQADLPLVAPTALPGPSAPDMIAAETERFGLPLVAREKPDPDRPGLPFLPPAATMPPAAIAQDEGGQAPPGRQDVAPPPQTLVPEAGSGARVAATEAALLEQIARAAAQGLVEADMGRMEDEIAAATHPRGLPPAAQPESPPSPEPPPPVTRRSHISITTSLDRSATDGLAETEDGAPCIDPAFFDLADWGAPISDGTEIGPYRTRLFGEFDIADGEGVTELARYYVYAGFGAEALAVIRRHPDDVVRSDLLVAMAQVMDYGHADPATQFIEQMVCDGATALWAVLAQPRLDRAQSINRRGVLLAFGALPPHLRRHLGPGLAARFLGIGDDETAAALNAAAGRGLDTAVPELDLLSARIAIVSGDLAGAESRLDALIGEGSGVLPEALIERVDASLARDDAVPEATLELIESVLFEHRGTEMGSRLRDAQIRALASASNFDGAFERLSAAAREGEFAAGRIDALSAMLFGRLARDASDAVFLRHVLSAQVVGAGLPTEERRAVAGRLLDLGFTRQARDVLDAGGVLPEPADRILYARAALIEAKPKVAVGYLAGLDDPVAQRLRAEAMAQASDHSGAGQAFQALGDGAGQVESAWLGGLWDQFEEGDETARAAAARLMLRDPIEADAPAGPPLTRSGDLLSASSETRETLARMLAEVPSPVE